ncbi:dTDP-4-amino-4,6-dideoxygalactose transaminase [Roseivirga sp.]|uniref:dTDP-4-amino-4,6-dideoxygalactose transaminase n=1 Tax=Roseivirga sp. TaxID=1964215 RepID=UPI002B271687|nr:dTDP-4-amino-4,6-dideoxygalactose transaminase [Roseivirga sp.]
MEGLIPFNKPYLTGKEAHYTYQAVNSGKISGNGIYTQKCHEFFENRFGFAKCLLTTSCTDALEMAAILLDIKAGDEVIMPSYTFVSTANAFVLRGAKIIFCDSRTDHPGMDESQIEKLITSRTRAIVVVHYAGVACDMDIVMGIADRYQLFVVEDAAQAIDSYYKNKPLGGIGHLAAFSFHETKNIISGEGGMLVVNAPEFQERAEVIWEKGTNRSAFFRGEVDKYNWVDIGSSFLPSEIISAFLYAQLENLKDIQNRRKQHWNQYKRELSGANLNEIQLPHLPSYASNNAHMFYLVCENGQLRDELIKFLKNSGVYAVFHYLSLHKSPFYSSKYDGNDLPEADKYSDNVVRLPLYYELKVNQITKITQLIIQFCNSYPS